MTEAICRDIIEWRQRVMPYTYMLVWQAHRDGLPTMRPLVLNYPDDPNVRDLGSQYLWGGDLLVAPVMRRGATRWTAYLPAGECTLRVHAPIGQASLVPADRRYILKLRADQEPRGITVPHSSWAACRPVRSRCVSRYKQHENQPGGTNMRRRDMLIGSSALVAIVRAHAAEPGTISLWHIYAREFDMIHLGIKLFNEANNGYRIEPRLIPYGQINPELIRALAKAAPPDLVVNDPDVSSYASQGQFTDLSDRVAKSTRIGAAAYKTAMSLREVNLGNIADPSRPFVGLDNFTGALADPVFRQLMTALNIAHIWFGMPFSMIRVAAALTNVPDELYEAAAIDGAGPPRQFRHITLPAIGPALLAVACLVTISSLRAFDVIFALTQGGPLNSTNVLPLLSYQTSFQDFNFGRDAALGSFAFLIVFAVALVYVRTLRSGQPA